MVAITYYHPPLYPRPSRERINSSFPLLKLRVGQVW
jgi:hypothetical protein